MRKPLVWTILLGFLAGLAAPRGLRAYWWCRCESRHGIGGSGGVRNPGSLKGVRARRLGHDFLELVQDDAELKQWILKGKADRPLANRIARYFLVGQRPPMPLNRPHPQGYRLDRGLHSVAEKGDEPVSAIARRLGAAAAIAALVLFASSCANNDAVLGISVAPPPGNPVSFSKNVEPIISNPASCASGGCHGSPLAAPMSLETGKAYGSLVGIKSCETNLYRVERGKSLMSYLIIKLRGTQSDVSSTGGCVGCVGFEPVGSCGAPMPRDLPPLSPAEIQIIIDWIDQGAQDN